ncbi:Ig domain-containing protein [Geobacter sp. DSM 9736]|uniref:Ig domain-containing protein n=1 Tax=Geobacter sp. DSM 9736 TaxID=1277350 RepID=UPI000B502A9B|nr:Ig domain-containing protein [Geobacter sp. DSM 9736]SNB47355.1 Putative Ig domain-containing protein [Geobacter sp. DSM 9736]
MLSAKTIVPALVSLALLASASNAVSQACPSLSLAPAPLPPAVDGTPYGYTISAYGGEAPVGFMVTRGALPPGITISAAGNITGTPVASGTFGFTVTATDSCRSGRQRAEQQLTLQVLPLGTDPSSAAPKMKVRAPLKLSASVSPATLPLKATPAPGRQVVYRLAAQPPETATMESPGGTFSAGGRVLGSVPAPITVVLINGSGSAEESILVPDKIIRQAKETGAATLVYSRPFSGRGTTALAVVEFPLGGEGVLPPKQ